MMPDYKRLTNAQVLELYQNSSFHDLAGRAAERTSRLFRPDIRTYVIERNINYTNVCTCRFSFCAFSVSPRDSRAAASLASRVAWIISARPSSLSFGAI